MIIGRLVDAEATPEDRRRFDDLAATEPDLWRVLALRQLDDDLLAEGLGEAIGPALDVEAPARGARGRPLSWTIAMSGWAAVLVIVVSWALVSWSGGFRGRAGERLAGDGDAPAPALTPDEHLDAYLAAPFVVGEEAPLLLEAIEHPDGHLELRVMRRVIERVDLAPGRDVPVADDGLHLATDPARLREPASGPSTSETDSDG